MGRSPEPELNAAPDQARAINLINKAAQRPTPPPRSRQEMLVSSSVFTHGGVTRSSGPLSPGPPARIAEPLCKPTQLQGSDPRQLSLQPPILLQPQLSSRQPDSQFPHQPDPQINKAEHHQ